MTEARHVVYDPPNEGLPYLSVLLVGDKADAVPCATREEAASHKFAEAAKAAKTIDDLE